MSKDTPPTRATADATRREADARLDAALRRSGLGRGPKASGWAAWAKGGGSARPGASTASRWLALVPVSAFVVGLALSLPRPASPEDVPLPAADARALRREAEHDEALADAVRQTPLPHDVRTLGSHLRRLRELERLDEGEAAAAGARAALDEALGPLLRDGRTAELARLRAVQLEAFLRELGAYEASGTVSDELAALSGRLVERLADAGWTRGHRVLLDEPARRALFKKGWAATLGLEAAPGFALALDEERALYALYLSRPHPSETVRRRLERDLAGASADGAAKLRADGAAAAELWRHEKVRELGRLDPAYPTDYARGVALYRARRYEASVQAFDAWLEAHPDGAYAQRARNHLAAALRATSTL